MFRLAVAVIEGEESRIRESLEGEEGEVQDQEWEKRRRGQKNRSRSHGLGRAEQTFGSQDKETQGLWDSDIFRP